MNRNAKISSIIIDWFSPPSKKFASRIFFSILQFFFSPVLSVLFLYLLKFSTFSTFSTLQSEDCLRFCKNHHHPITLLFFLKIILQFKRIFFFVSPIISFLTSRVNELTTFILFSTVKFAFPSPFDFRFRTRYRLFFTFFYFHTAFFFDRPTCPLPLSRFLFFVA